MATLRSCCWYGFKAIRARGGQIVIQTGLRPHWACLCGVAVRYCDHNALHRGKKKE